MAKNKEKALRDGVSANLGIASSFTQRKATASAQQTAPTPPAAPQTKADEVNATFKLPASLLRQLRKFAVDREMKQKDIITEALQIYMAEH